MTDINQLIPVDYSNERVLTTEQLAEVYGCSPDAIKKNFSNNKDKFIEGIHYFKLENTELKQFKDRVKNVHLVGKNASTIILWTRRGCSRHCKMIGTDAAWDMFDQLEDCYFQRQKPMTMAEIVAANANRLVEIERQNNAIAAEQIKQAEEIREIKAQVTTTDTNYYSISGYASYIGKHIGNEAAKKLGKEASKLSRQQKYPIYQAHSSVWGHVNTYHKDILTIIFR